jgi:plastocyanin
MRLLGVAVVLLALVAPAHAADLPPALVVIRSVTNGTRYVPGDTSQGFPHVDLTVSKGQSLDAVNADIPLNAHSLTSDDCWVDGTIQPCIQDVVTYHSHIFDSGQFKADAGVTPVIGVETVPAGTYTFFCTIHGHAMTGSLTVS